jgi:glutaredoxin 3
MAAKALLRKKNALFSEIGVDGDPAARAAMTERAHGRRTVPQIFIGDRHIGGSDDLHALEAAGKLDPLLAG